MRKRPAQRPAQRPVRARAGKPRAAAAKTRKAATDGPRAGTKSAALLGLLEAGTTVPQISRKFGWQPHSSRAMITVLRQRLGLKIESSKADGEDRVYRISRK